MKRGRWKRGGRKGRRSESLILELRASRVRY